MSQIQPPHAQPPQPYAATYPPHQPYPPHPVARPTNGTAIAALVTALLGMAIVPVVLGHLALRQIRRRDEAGTALAVVGLVLGYLSIAGYLLLAVVVFGSLWFGLSSR